MKAKLITILCVLLSICTYAKADNDKVIPFNNLPASAQQFISTHFAKSNISQVMEESDKNNIKEYKVYFNDGCKVEFNNTGEWESIEANKSFVPEKAINPQIKGYINKTYPQFKVVSIEKERKGYDVKLQNGLELKFDSNGNFIKLDK